MDQLGQVLVANIQKLLKFNTAERKFLENTLLLCFVSLRKKLASAQMTECALLLRQGACCDLLTIFIEYKKSFNWEEKFYVDHRLIGYKFVRKNSESRERIYSDLKFKDCAFSILQRQCHDQFEWLTILSDLVL
jgi:hypothetical protein